MPWQRVSVAAVVAASVAAAAFLSVCAAVEVNADDVSENKEGDNLDSLGGPTTEAGNVTLAETEARHNASRGNGTFSAARQFVYYFRTVLEGGVVSVVAVVGVAGNILSMFVLLKRRLDLQPFLCRLLVLLTCFDTIFLVAEFMLYSLPLLSQNYVDFVYPLLAPKFLIPISQISLTGSVYTIVAVTVERYVSCCWPHVGSRDGAVFSTASVVGIVLVSVLFNVSRFFEYATEQRELTPVEREEVRADTPHHIVKEQFEVAAAPYEVRATDLRTNTAYIGYYLLAANGSVMVVIPFVSLLILNWQIHRAIQKREAFKASLGVARNTHQAVAAAASAANGCKHSKERDVTVGQVLVAIVVMFLFCQSFKVIVVCYEVVTYLLAPDGSRGRNQMYPVWVEIFINLNHVALAFNAAINIAIYICKDKKFRAACLGLLPSACVCPGSDSMAHTEIIVRESHSRESLVEAASPVAQHKATAISARNGGVHLELVPRRDVVVTASDRLQLCVDASSDSREAKFNV